MRSWRPVAGLGCVLCALGLAAPAEAREDATGVRRGPYVRVYTGIGVTAASDLRIRQPGLGTDLTFEDISWEHKSLSTDWTRDSIPYVGVRAGFFPTRYRWLSLSGEVVHFKVFAPADESTRVRGVESGVAVDTVAPLERFVQQYQVSNGVNLLLGNVAVHRALARTSRFPDGRLDVHVGGGAGVTIPFTRSSIGGRSQGQYDWGRVVAQLSVGAAWRLFRRWDVAGEYKLTTTTADGSVPGGDSLARLRTQHLVFGLGFLLSP